MPNPIRFVFEASTKSLDAGVDRSERLVKGMADTAEKAGRRVDGAFESTAEHADNVASKGSQAAGAFSGLGSLAALSGGKVGALGNSMMLAGVATQGLADAGDLLNVVTDSTIGKKIAERAATIGSAVASKAAAIATGGLAVAQRILNAAMSTNPLLLVVTGLVLLVGALVLAYRRSATFRAIVNGVFHSVQGVAGRFVGFFTRTIPGAVSRVVGFVKARWPLILAIMAGPLGLVVLAVTRNIDRIRGLFNNVIGFVAGVPGRIGNLAGRFADAGGRLIRSLIDGLGNTGSSIGNLAASIVNAVVDYLNGILPHSISINKGPLHFSAPLFPTIPHLAAGGITTGPMLALIGDNPGGREAVIPLDKFDLNGGPREVKIYLTPTPTTSPYDQGEAVAEALRAFFDGGGQL